jgi:crossover junction endodeoxyribonuclease RusA
MKLVIRLPFPAPELFPNRKNGKHWSSTTAIKVKQHTDGYNATKAAGAFKAQDGHIPLSLLFLTPDNRKRDADNMLAASKALIDGMAKALGVDDSRFRPVLVDWRKGPDKVGALIAGVGVHSSDLSNWTSGASA